MPENGGEVGELLIPPHNDADTLRPLFGGRSVSLGGETMGTEWRLSAVAPPTISDQDIAAALGAVFASVIAQMSQWEPDSELSRYNRGAPGSTHVISPQFHIVLDCALQIARVSGWSFDPTLGAVSELWGFGTGPDPELMPDGALADAMERRDRYALTMPAFGEPLIQPGGIRLDFSGIAKGFAVDMGIAALQRLGIHHALLEVGGELRAIGVQSDGMPWWVDCDVPPDSEAPVARIALSGWAVATSGNYYRRRTAEGHSWSHSFDPVSGWPLGDDVLSVTVLHHGCMQADALATAILVKGPTEGITFADMFGIPARIVADDQIHTSAAWLKWRE
ncbi:FAD:protein FMN transferase [Altererythrobacter indicus]|uniref:FAD:protein FMN transferase n=1 Tax=Altericroceibacterium indicum TaxID=374177 RepID=A0A845A914_9SPHN|nr:FAD:protein FMN transferase [Altericroceibacterium indicum]MXP25046.1 FAD:protein FMN transferase [Altericroceibacterium indicum]